MGIGIPILELLILQPTGKDGGTLFVKWAARARGHRLRHQGYKSSKSSQCKASVKIEKRLGGISSKQGDVISRLAVFCELLKH